MRTVPSPRSTHIRHSAWRDPAEGETGGQTRGITILNLNRAYRIDEKFFKKLASKILARVKRPKEIELEVVFLDDRAIKVFNKRYRGRNAPTDVLSFKLGMAEFGRRAFVGEILVSSETAFVNSKVFGTEFREELARCVVHGALHLFGYDDKTAHGRIMMSKREEGLLNLLCMGQRSSKVLTPR